MDTINMTDNDKEIRFALVNTLRVGRKNVTKISELCIDKKDIFRSFKKLLGSCSIETIRGTYCNLVMSKSPKDEAEHIHTFMLEGSESEKEYIPGSFILAGHIRPSGTFDDLDQRIDEEWIENRLLLSVYRGKKRA